MFDFQIVSTWLHGVLTGVMPEWAAILTESVLVALLIITLYAVFAIVLIYMERKICAFFQCRLGPMRVGKWGLLQVFSDVFKMLTKEIIEMRQSDRLLHNMAPFLVVAASMTTFACLPWNMGGHIIDFNVGVFFFLAIGSIGVVGILLAGWSINNKYSLIGAMRSGAQIISYELSIGHFVALAAFIVYLIAGNAECNRGPFDLPESESELTAGYHTEYSGMHFGYYYLAEYLNLFICAGMATTIFLGGWAPIYFPGLEGFNDVMALIPGCVWFLGKTFFVVFLLMWERWTFPRLRIDQILSLEWKYLLPFTMVLLVVMALCVSLGLTF